MYVCTEFVPSSGASCAATRRSSRRASGSRASWRSSSTRNYSDENHHSQTTLWPGYVREMDRARAGVSGHSQHGSGSLFVYDHDAGGTGWAGVGVSGRGAGKRREQRRGGGEWGKWTGKWKRGTWSMVGIDVRTWVGGPRSIDVRNRLGGFHFWWLRGRSRIQNPSFTRLCPEGPLCDAVADVTSSVMFGILAVTMVWVVYGGEQSVFMQLFVLKRMHDCALLFP